jgi:hypothetical protein
VTRHRRKDISKTTEQLFRTTGYNLAPLTTEFKVNGDERSDNRSQGGGSLITMFISIGLLQSIPLRHRTSRFRAPATGWYCRPDQPNPPAPFPAREGGDTFNRGRAKAKPK